MCIVIYKYSGACIPYVLGIASNAGNIDNISYVYVYILPIHRYTYYCNLETIFMDILYNSCKTEVKTLLINIFSFCAHAQITDFKSNLVG